MFLRAAHMRLLHTQTHTLRPPHKYTQILVVNARMFVYVAMLQ